MQIVLKALSNFWKHIWRIEPDIIFKLTDPPLHEQAFACACRQFTNHRAAWSLLTFGVALRLVNDRQAQAKYCPWRGPVTQCSNLIKTKLKETLNWSRNFEGKLFANSIKIKVAKILSSFIICHTEYYDAIDT